MNYQVWYNGLDATSRAVWDEMLLPSNPDDDCAPLEVMADWCEEHGAPRWYAQLADQRELYVRGTDYRRWEELGLDAIMGRHEMTYVNQEPDGFDTLRGEWFIADDDSLAIIYGTFRNDNSPGASHYTYATVYATEAEYKAALAQWEGKEEYLEADDDDWQGNDESDEEGDWTEEGGDGWDETLPQQGAV